VDHPNDHFSPSQYILGDSAYEARWFMIPAFKKPQGLEIPREHEVFNSALGKARVISEHCIGILEGRFRWLRAIPCKLTESPSSMRRILEYIDCCVILHNLLVERKDHCEPGDWDADDEDFSDVDDTDRVEALVDQAQLNQPVPDGSAAGHRRISSVAT